jgi:hypothetical protein
MDLPPARSLRSGPTNGIGADGPTTTPVPNTPVPSAIDFPRRMKNFRRDRCWRREKIHLQTSVKFGNSTYSPRIESRAAKAYFPCSV